MASMQTDILLDPALQEVFRKDRQPIAAPKVAAPELHNNKSQRQPRGSPILNGADILQDYNIAVDRAQTCKSKCRVKRLLKRISFVV